jgi:integrase
MFSIRKYLAHANKEKSSIIFSISDKKRLKLPSAISIETKYWDSKLQRVKTAHPNSFNLNYILDQKFKFLNELCAEHYKNYNELNFDELKHSIKKFNNNESEKSITLINLIDEYLKERKIEINLKESSATVYKSFKNTVIKFELLTKKEVLVDQIEKTFQLEFKDYLSKIGNSDNTIKSKFIILNTLLNYAYDKKYINNQEYKKFKIKGHKTDSVILTDDDIKKIHAYETNRRTQIDIRIKFLIQIYTGLRLSDLMRLTDDKIDLKNKIITIITKKPNKEIVIPISKKLTKILENINVSNLIKDHGASHYNSKLKRLLRDAGLTETVVITEFKNNIQIEHKLPKYEVISSHTARRTFITKLIQSGLSPSEIMIITGHNSRSSLDKYIRIPDSDAIKAVRNKIDSW